MTLHEIEETLHTLASRHQGLDEAMLVTLLRAGGWEEKYIAEARSFFRAQSEPTKKLLPHEETKEFLSLQTEPVFEPAIPPDHLLDAHNEMQEEGSHRVEPQSLVAEQISTAPETREEFPHNLPLRPFETSEHIWPFSRYRDVFYGDTPEEKKSASVQEVSKVIHDTISSLPTQAVQMQTEVSRDIHEPTPPSSFQQQTIERIVEKKVVTPPPEVHIAPVKLERGDEKLVVLASVMLLVLLLLLGYLYSNGRL